MYEYLYIIACIWIEAFYNAKVSALYANQRRFTFGYNSDSDSADNNVELTLLAIRKAESVRLSILGSCLIVAPLLAPLIVVLYSIAPNTQLRMSSNPPSFAEYLTPQLDY